MDSTDNSSWLHCTEDHPEEGTKVEKGWHPGILKPYDYLSVYTTHTNSILSWTWMSPCQWISIMWTESNQSCVYAQHLEKLNWDPDPWRLTLIGCWHYSNSQPNQNTEREWTSATLILATQIITLKHHGLKPHHSQAPCHTRDQNIHSRFDHHGGRTSSGWQDVITQTE